jgi:hypothetical protein
MNGDPQIPALKDAIYSMDTNDILRVVAERIRTDIKENKDDLQYAESDVERYGMNTTIACLTALDAMILATIESYKSWYVY